MIIKINNHPELEVPPKLEREVMALTQKIMFPHKPKEKGGFTSKAWTPEENDALVTAWQEVAAIKTMSEFCREYSHVAGRTESSISARLYSRGYK